MRTEEDLVFMSNCIYNTTLSGIRKTAYKYVKSNNIRYPASWDATEMADKDWILGMKKRHPKLNIKSLV